MITISSIFRDSESYITRYIDQIDNLREHVDVRLVLGEGDSDDATPAMLRRYIDPGDKVITVNHYGPKFGSTDNPVRWGQISQVVRKVVAAVDDPGDAFIWVEADLLWEPHVMLELIAYGYPVAPMCFCENVPSRLYDTWGERQDGHLFRADHPYWPVSVPEGRYGKVTSVGSCFCLPANHFHLARDWNGIWPFPCDLMLDTRVKVRHP